MNAMTIDIVGPRGPHTGWAPPFQFSEQHSYLSRAFCCTHCHRPIHEKPGEQNHIFYGDSGPFCPNCAWQINARIVRHEDDPLAIPAVSKPGPAYAGPMPPPCVTRPITHHKTSTKTWRDALPAFRFEAPLKDDGLVQPFNTALPWHAMTFANRHTELSWLQETQARELASLPEEMRANGLTAISLSSSSSNENDDDKEAANLAEHHLKRVPYDPSPDELAPVLRRLDWEKYVTSCSVASRIYLDVDDEGHRWIASNDQRYGPDVLTPYAPRLKEAQGERSTADLVEDRERAHHYGKVVWSLMTPEQQLDWTKRAIPVRDYLAGGDDNVARLPFFDAEDEQDGAPQEIGLHTNGLPTEPTEYDLWPITDQELVTGIVPLPVHIARANKDWFSWAYGERERN